MEIETFYQNRLADLTEKINKIHQKEFRVSITRLIAFFLFMALAIYTFQQNTYLFILTIIVFFFAFLFLVKHQLKLKSIKTRKENQERFYQNELEILKGSKNHCFDGAGMTNEKHAYAFDLDIIGSSSLYQKINRSKTYFGTRILSNYLLEHPTLSQVRERQEAISEINGLSKWREEFHGSLFGLDGQHHIDIAGILKQNLTIDDSFIFKKGLNVLVNMVPYIWVVLFIIFFLFGENFKPLLYGFGIVIFVIYFRYAKQVGEIQLALSKSIENFSAYTDALKIIFIQPWKSSLLQSTLSTYHSTENTLAVKELVGLKKLIDLLDYRLNMIVGIILNLFLLWDFRIVRKIGQWKEKNDYKVKELFTIVGLFETLSSLAIWKFNNPSYSLPIISEGSFHIETSNLKHPLIDENISVGNDINLSDSDYVNIITGSNMSGKSTFLRAIGINIILGNTGTVCSAGSMNYSLTKVMTYMRIKDSLEENASTFKAELNRIKQMLEILNDKENTLLLIDEMLRGTNSKDKLKGSIAIAKKILESKTHSIIATHDLQLTEIEKDAPSNVKNYYFDIDFENGELRFDYKLKSGVCQNFNASYLLEKIGIKTS
jgi:hypothetical protein